MTGDDQPGGYTRGVTGPYTPPGDDEEDRPVCAIACNDLLAYSRLASAARAAGYTPLQVEGPLAVRAAAQEAACILIDLQDPAGGLASVRAAKKTHLPIYAVGPHVETDLLKAAQEAGATKVLTHNAASSQLGGLLREAVHRPLEPTRTGDPDRKTGGPTGGHA